MPNSFSLDFFTNPRLINYNKHTLTSTSDHMQHGHISIGTKSITRPWIIIIFPTPTQKRVRSWTEAAGSKNKTSGDQTAWFNLLTEAERNKVSNYNRPIILMSALMPTWSWTRHNQTTFQRKLVLFPLDWSLQWIIALRYRSSLVWVLMVVQSAAELTFQSHQYQRRWHFMCLTFYTQSAEHYTDINRGKRR